MKTNKPTHKKLPRAAARLLKAPAVTPGITTERDVRNTVTPWSHPDEVGHPTPLTDAQPAEGVYDESGCWDETDYFVKRDFARILERQLAQSEERVKDWQDDALNKMETLVGYLDYFDKKRPICGDEIPAVITEVREFIAEQRALLSSSKTN